MDGDSNIECSNVDSPIKPAKIENLEGSEDAESLLNKNDIPMEGIECQSTQENEAASIAQAVETADIEDNSKIDAKRNGEIPISHETEATQMDEDVTPGTSANNRPASAVRRPAGSRPKTSRFAKRNYRTQILSTSSSSSNRSTPERQVQPENADMEEENVSISDQSDFQINEAVWNEDDDDDDDNDDDDDDDDDDDNSSYSYDYHSTPKCDAESIKDTILKKQKPAYKLNLLVEIINREHGLSPHVNGLQSMNNRISSPFHERIYGARQTIEQMKLLHTLQEHDGCVNSLNFNKSGSLLASGSDDLKIIIWDWSANKIKYSLNSGHHSNVFQTKFIEFGGSETDISIVSSGRDGQVRFIKIPPGGSSSDARSRVLLKHSGSVHKISPSPHIPYEILTAGEDGQVFRCDVRDNRVEKVCAVKVKKRKVPLYSIAHNPHEPHFCVCGRDQFVRVYDKRNTKDSLFMMCPEHLENKKAFVSHITCAVYNSSGSEILASYSDEDIYSFNARLYIDGKHMHRYRGHNNNKTIKGVNYFGLNSEYVVSGSDCGHFFIWDSETEAILNWKKADYMGVVNCLEPHPSFPVLATSGLDHDVKLWAPLNEKYPPAMEGLEKCLKNNARRMSGSNLFDDRTLYFFVRQCLRNRRQNAANVDCPNVDDFSSSDSGNDGDNDCDIDENNLHLQSFPPCNPQ